MSKNFKVFKGEKRKLNLTIQEDGEDVDLSNANVNFVVARNLPAEEKLIDKDAINESADGTCVVNLDATDTDLDPKLYYWEAWVEFQDGSVYPAEVGLFLVKRRVEK